MEDYDFALASYLDSTRPLLIALGRWDEERVVSRFAESFEPEQIEILSAAGTDIGWLQVSETSDEIHLDQLHLVDGARNHGIGSRLIRELQDRAAATDRTLTLNVIRGNRAQGLYERLGFLLIGGDEEKIQMVWQSDGSHKW
jgi:ribosomal protein S18 acetylase RimI-like enzyme